MLGLAAPRLVIAGRWGQTLPPRSVRRCSERCKMVDLGRWFAEDYRVSQPLRPDHFAEFEELQGDGLDLPRE